MTISDKGHRGEWKDISELLLGQLLAKMGVQVVATHLVSDETNQITARLVNPADGEGIDLVLTIGGTGLSPRDLTPEATRAVIEREMPGLAELLRWEKLVCEGSPVLDQLQASADGQSSGRHRRWHA